MINWKKVIMQHTDLKGVGDVLLDDDGKVTVDGVAAPDALVDMDKMRIDLTGNGVYDIDLSPPEEVEVIEITGQIMPGPHS